MSNVPGESPAPTPTLRVYISRGCPACRAVPAVLRGVRGALPRLQIDVIDVDQPRVVLPDVVFSVPTYTLDDQVVSLGNPADDFPARLAARLAGAERT